MDINTASRKPSLAVYCSDHARIADASALAARLSLPLVTAAQNRYDFLLTYTPWRLELRRAGQGAPGPIYANFVSGPLGYRRIHGGGRRQPLARALGVRTSFKPYVIDATAGLGGDAFLLGTLGCRVLMLERSDIVHALLADGLHRAQNDPALMVLLDDRLRLRHLDAIGFLRTLIDRDRPDAIYLDPMYPHRRASALSKKEMRVLRELVGDDEDVPELLASALACATQRVVVKRPRLASVVRGPEPNMQLRGRSTRYDVYVVGSRHEE